MIALRDGWWWPEVDRDAHGVIMRDAITDVPAFLALVTGRTQVVQAGGNVGVYPAMLAQHFQTVLTVEPDALNYDCLKRNLRARDVRNIAHMRAAFGEDVCRGAIEIIDARNVGAHRMKKGATGDVEILRIDDLPLEACDAIWLDIEGYELSALRGAEATIRKYGPVICAEDKGLGGHYGVPPGAIQAWLATLGYSETAKIGRDKVFTRTA